MRSWLAAVRVQVVGQRQLGVVLLAVELAAVQQVQVRVGRRALGDDAGQLGADDLQGELAGRHLGGVARGAEAELPVGLAAELHGGGARHLLVDGAQDRRGHEQRSARVAVAHGVEEAVDGGAEPAQAHHVGVDQVDADLDADQVGRQVPDRARGELVEQGAAAEAEVDELDAAQARGKRGPGAGGV
jgi:hypothetical protein